MVNNGRTLTLSWGRLSGDQEFSLWHILPAPFLALCLNSRYPPVASVGELGFPFPPPHESGHRSVVEIRERPHPHQLSNGPQIASNARPTASRMEGECGSQLGVGARFAKLETPNGLGALEGNVLEAAEAPFDDLGGYRVGRPDEAAAFFLPSCHSSQGTDQLTGLT